jgi:aryl-alcohol dehydrogenase-like predicted oxidoreductase
MDYRQLGNSGLKVSALSFGTGTFGGGNEFFRAWGQTTVDEAKRMIDICLDAGINLFDTADVYSNGLSEEILGKAIAGKRQNLLISTKTTFRFDSGPNDVGSSRYHILRACEGSLRRLRTDYIDIYHMHGFDGLTPVEETLETLDTLVRSGKVRYVACSNLFWLAPDEITGGFGEIRLGALYRAPSLLFAPRTRVRMGTHAARHRSEDRGASLEPTGLGSPNWQDSEESSDAGR